METTFAYPWAYKVLGHRCATFDLLVRVERQDDGDPMICSLTMYGFDAEAETGIKTVLPHDLNRIALKQLSLCAHFLDAAETAIKAKEAALQEVSA